MVHVQDVRGGGSIRFQAGGIVLLLSPFIALITAGILLGLLGIFVTWLLIVASLLAALVAFDLADSSRRRFARTFAGYQRGQ
jgi:hypothetical protein